jgi:hypothetical protein
MKRLPLFASVLALGLGFIPAVQHSRHSSFPGDGDNPALAVNGAFRDGLYSGKLAAESGRPLQAPIGRWAAADDRTFFAKGYERGYKAFLANRLSVADASRHAQ